MQRLGDSVPVHQFFTKLTQMRRPSELFVFMDEDPVSINDGMFIVYLETAREFLDLPARRHDCSWIWNFADGHVGSYQMQDSKTINSQGGALSGQNADWQMLTDHTTQLISGP
jgi:hypothetical protein